MFGLAQGGIYIPGKAFTFSPVTGIYTHFPVSYTHLDLSADDVIRHYDVTGKKCPLYFVEHEDAWEQFHKDLDTYIEENGEMCIRDST